MAIHKTTCGGATVYVDSETGKRYTKTKCGGATVITSGSNTWYKTKRGGATSWESSRHSGGCIPFMDDDED